MKKSKAVIILLGILLVVGSLMGCAGKYKGNEIVRGMVSKVESREAPFTYTVYFIEDGVREEYFYEYTGSNMYLTVDGENFVLDEEETESSFEVILEELDIAQLSFTSDVDSEVSIKSKVVTAVGRMENGSKFTTKVAADGNWVSEEQEDFGFMFQFLK